MSSVLAVTPDDPKPPHEQLRRQLADLIESGQFVEGVPLPPLRQLAGDLGLAVGTVARTYHELEAAGLARSPTWRRDQVAPGPVPLLVRERARHLDEPAVTFAARAKALGASEEEVHEAVSRSLV